MAGHSARQQQVGYVRAGDQKYTSNRAQQNQQRRSNVSDQRHQCRFQSDTLTSICVGILLLESLGDCINFGLCLSFADAGLEARDHMKKMGAALTGYRRSPRSVVSDCGPKIERFILNWKLEAVRHHSDNRVALAVERYRMIQHIWIGIEATGEHSLA